MEARLGLAVCGISLTARAPTRTCLSRDATTDSISRDIYIYFRRWHEKTTALPLTMLGHISCIDSVYLKQNGTKCQVLWSDISLQWSTRAILHV